MLQPARLAYRTGPTHIYAYLRKSTQTVPHWSFRDVLYHEAVSMEHSVRELTYDTHGPLGTATVTHGDTSRPVGCVGCS
jgi:hypothetical protein